VLIIWLERVSRLDLLELVVLEEGSPPTLSYITSNERRKERIVRRRRRTKNRGVGEVEEGKLRSSGRNR
jgi:hypothetical protein